MPTYGFEYFCGANVIVRIGDMPLLEASGLSLSVNETKRPIYAYCNRHFDAVASGQVLVQGTLLINYVHHDYLYRAIRLGKNIQDNPPPVDLPKLAPADYMSMLGENSGQADEELVAALKNTFWSGGKNQSKGFAPNPHDDGSGINLEVVFGEQDGFLTSNGKTGYIISNLHFVGRSQVINISEEVILESHSFIARNIYSLTPDKVTRTSVIDATTPDVQQTITISN